MRPSLYGKAGLRTRKWRELAVAKPASPDALPSHGHVPTVADSMRTLSLTVAGAVQGLRRPTFRDRAPVSRFIRLPGSAGGHLAAAAGP